MWLLPHLLIVSLTMMNRSIPKASPELAFTSLELRLLDAGRGHPDVVAMSEDDFVSGHDHPTSSSRSGKEDEPGPTWLFQRFARASVSPLSLFSTTW